MDKNKEPKHTFSVIYDDDGRSYPHHGTVAEAEVVAKAIYDGDMVLRTTTVIRGMVADEEPARVRYVAVYRVSDRKQLLTVSTDGVVWS